MPHPTGGIGAPPRKGPSATKLSKEETRRRFFVAEEILVRMLTVRRAAPEVARQLRMTIPSAERLLRQVRDIWDLESAQSDPEKRRTEYRAGAQHLYTASLSKRVVAHDADGKVAMAKDGQPVTIAAPDLRTAARALELMARLDGLYTETLSVDIGAGLAGLAVLADSVDADVIESADTPMGRMFKAKSPPRLTQPGRPRGSS
jgi:hypothetical protein